MSWDGPWYGGWFGGWVGDGTGPPPAPFVRQIRRGLGTWAGLGLSTRRFRRVGS